MVRYDLAERYMDLAQNNLLSAYNSVKEFLRNQAIKTTFCDYRENIIINDPEQPSKSDTQAFKITLQQGIDATIKALLEVKEINICNNCNLVTTNIVKLHYSNSSLTYFIEKYCPLGTLLTLELNDFHALYELLEDIKLVRRVSKHIFYNELNFTLESA